MTCSSSRNRHTKHEQPERAHGRRYRTGRSIRDLSDENNLTPLLNVFSALEACPDLKAPRITLLIFNVLLSPCESLVSPW
jgi:hypothetical protein